MRTALPQLCTNYKSGKGSLLAVVNKTAAYVEVGFGVRETAKYLEEVAAL